MSHFACQLHAGLCWEVAGTPAAAASCVHADLLDGSLPHLHAQVTKEPPGVHRGRPGGEAGWG